MLVNKIQGFNVGFNTTYYEILDHVINIFNQSKL